jgi:hypothetical protein
MNPGNTFLSSGNGSVYISGWVGGGTRGGAKGQYSVAIGGFGAEASGGNSVAIGGSNAFAQASDSAVIGGDANTISGTGTKTFIGGGYLNSITNNNGGIIGGQQNELKARLGFIGGGQSNKVDTNGHYCAIIGGNNNTTQGGGDRSAIAGGGYNILNGEYSGILGGFQNTISTGNYSSTVGGRDNTTSAEGAVIIGASGLTISDPYTTGMDNTYVNSHMTYNTYSGVSIGNEQLFDADNGMVQYFDNPAGNLNIRTVNVKNGEVYDMILSGAGGVGINSIGSNDVGFTAVDNTNAATSSYLHVRIAVVNNLVVFSTL